MSEKKQKKSIFILIQWLPTIAIFLFLPFYMKYHIADSFLKDYPWSSGSEQIADVSLYGKQQFLTMLFVLFCFIVPWQIYQRKKEKELVYKQNYWHILIPLCTYFLLVLLSSLCSEYGTAAFLGTEEQFESCFAVLSYFMILLHLILKIRTEEDLRIFIWIITVSMIFLGLLGVLQYTGHNPLSLAFVQELFLPSGYIEEFGLVESIFEEGRVSLTSYNPNYAGVLLALLSSFCLGLLLTERNIRKIFLKAILLILLLITLVGTGSKAGLLVFGAVAALAMLFLGRQLIKYWYFVIPCIGLFFVLGEIILYTARLPLLENIQNILRFEKNAENPITVMDTDEDGIHIVYDNFSFNISYLVQNGYFYLDIVSSDGTIYETMADETRMAYYLTDETLPNFLFEPTAIGDNLYGLKITMNNREWFFVEYKGMYYYINEYGRLVILSPIERIGFSGHELFASSRGLIWSQTIPLLKDHLIVGSGANTFVFEYPQTNYKDMYFYLGTPQIVTRPHCMYLQSAVESGVLGLGCLLIFFAWYLLRMIRICWKTDLSTLHGKTSFSCLLATMTYLICGLTNDSMVTVSPLFWGILGVGLASAYLAEQRNTTLLISKEEITAIGEMSNNNSEFMEREGFIHE